MSQHVRFLVVDGYTQEARNELVAGGASVAAELYTTMLCDCLKEAHCDVIFPSDPGARLPTGVDLEQYHGIAWTGCSLSIYQDDDPRVRLQIELAREAYAKGIPSFGSCWGAQIAVVAAGGQVQPNPRGREMGIARKIRLTRDGRAHPLYLGKPSVFDGFISHEDEVTHLPPGSQLLASNSFTHVQSVAVTYKKGSFWGLQYHPEYDLHEIARLTYCRTEKLLRGGFFRDCEAANGYVELLESLHRDPQRTDLAWLLGVDEDVMDAGVRQCEVRNWIQSLVLPNVRR